MISAGCRRKGYKNRALYLGICINCDFFIMSLFAIRTCG